jgi:hypothetical protein
VIIVQEDSFLGKGDYVQHATFVEKRGVMEWNDVTMTTGRAKKEEKKLKRTRKSTTRKWMTGAEPMEEHYDYYL